MNSVLNRATYVRVLQLFDLFSTEELQLVLTSLYLGKSLKL